MAHSDNRGSSDQATAIYVYGIVPADVQVEPDAEGIGDPPAPVAVIRRATR